MHGAGGSRGAGGRADGGPVPPQVLSAGRDREGGEGEGVVLRAAAEPGHAPGRAAPRGDGEWGGVLEPNPPAPGCGQDPVPLTSSPSSAPPVLHADGSHPAAAGVRGSAHPLADGGALRDGGRDGAAGSGQGGGHPHPPQHTPLPSCAQGGGLRLPSRSLLPAPAPCIPPPTPCASPHPAPCILPPTPPMHPHTQLLAPSHHLHTPSHHLRAPSPPALCTLTPGSGGPGGWWWGGGVSQLSLTPPLPPQIRASRLEQIDKELMEAQDKVQQPEPQVLGPGAIAGVCPRSPWGGGARAGWRRGPGTAPPAIVPVLSPLPAGAAQPGLCVARAP